MRALLVDFGGVLTTNVFESFREFAEAEGLERDAVRELFRSNPDALALLRELEKGDLDSDEFSQRVAPYLGVEPADCVFVDDLRENCAGAEAVGMTAILHRGAERTLPRLEELLGVPLQQPAR